MAGAFLGDRYRGFQLRSEKHVPCKTAHGGRNGCPVEAQVSITSLKGCCLGSISGTWRRNETVLLCTREQYFEGFGFAPFLAPSSRHVPDCPWDFLLHTCLIPMAPRGDNMCSKGAAGQPQRLLLWDPSGAHGTPRIISGSISARCCMGVGTCLNVFHSFSGQAYVMRFQMELRCRKNRGCAKRGPKILVY